MVFFYKFSGRGESAIHSFKDLNAFLGFVSETSLSLVRFVNMISWYHDINEPLWTIHGWNNSVLCQRSSGWFSYLYNFAPFMAEYLNSRAWQKYLMCSGTQMVSNKYKSIKQVEWIGSWRNLQWDNLPGCDVYNLDPMMLVMMMMMVRKSDSAHIVPSFHTTNLASSIPPDPQCAHCRHWWSGWWFL